MRITRLIPLRVAGIAVALCIGTWCLRSQSLYSSDIGKKKGPERRGAVIAAQGGHTNLVQLNTQQQSFVDGANPCMYTAEGLAPRPSTCQHLNSRFSK